MQREYRIGAADFWLKNSWLYNLPKIQRKKENSVDCEISQKRFPINILKNNPYILKYKALDKELPLFQLRDGYVLHSIILQAIIIKKKAIFFFKGFARVIP